MVETLDSWIQAIGPLAYLALFVAALFEYVFPPFPGDSVVLLGGVYAIRGERPWVLVLAVVTAGSLVGAVIDYAVGRRLATSFERRPDFTERHPNIHHLQQKMHRRGVLLIAFNRFLPGVRGLLFIAAGAARIDLRKVLGWGAVSALLWNGLIMAAGIVLGGNAERLEQWVRQYTKAAWIALAVVAAGAVAWQAIKRRRVEAPRGG
ncbi:MAG: DedA family protein [Myxococcaceae bacterium]|nr:DedA family protein [Myxococcaceae bacterium]